MRAMTNCRTAVGAIVALSTALVHPAAAAQSQTCGEPSEWPPAKIVAAQEDAFGQDPADALLQRYMANTYVSAWASKGSALPVQVCFYATVAASPIPWPAGATLEVVQAATPEQVREGAANLEKAIHRYQRSIAIDDQDPYTWFAYAWTLQQSAASRDVVVDAFRRAAEVAWAYDDERTSRRPPAPTVGSPEGFLIVIPDASAVRFTVPPYSNPREPTLTEIAIEHLMPLLEPVTDRLERDRLAERAAVLRQRRLGR